jgi:hypothetical protein
VSHSANIAPPAIDYPPRFCIQRFEESFRFVNRSGNAQSQINGLNIVMLASPPSCPSAKPRTPLPERAGQIDHDASLHLGLSVAPVVEVKADAAQWAVVDYSAAAPA